MKKIVFVCMDEDYVAVLEYKLAALVGQSAELEFVTDASYMEYLFSTPRRIDILILPETMMGFQTDKLNVGKLLYLTEEKIDSQSDMARIDTVYKYGSVRYLVKKMDGTLLEEASQGNKKETKIIGVFSTTGGCGKTLSSLAMAYHLQRKGNRVLYVSMEPLQDFESYMQGTEKVSNEFAYQCTINIKNALKLLEQEIRQEEFDYLPPFRKLPVTYQIGFETYVEIVQHMKEKNAYDYIVVELSHEITTKKVSFIQECDKVIFVTTQDKVAILKLEKLLRDVTQLREKGIIICNRCNQARENYLEISSLSSEYEVSEYADEFSDGIVYQDIKIHQIFQKTANCLE